VAEEPAAEDAACVGLSGAVEETHWLYNRVPKVTDRLLYCRPGVRRCWRLTTVLASAPLVRRARTRSLLF
jgi:hypothetical protein